MDLRIFWVKMLFLLFLVLPGFTVLAQPHNITPGKRLIVKISVPHIFINSLNLEIEKGFKNTRHSLQVSPRFYAGSTRTIDGYTGRNADDQKPGTVLGYGVEVLHRVYLGPPPATAGERQFYMSYGANFHHFNLTYNRFGWVEEPNERGLNYYHYKARAYTDQIDRWGGVLQLGWQEAFIKERVLLDFYTGLSYRESNLSAATIGQPERYQVTSLDFGYTGLSLVSGLKLGYVIR